MDGVSATATSKLKVFVSYSRDDIEFADQLVHALDACGFDPKIDRHEMTGGEEFRARLTSLIAAADTVVFVLSPTSAVSENVAWELSETARYSKRLIPIVNRPLVEVRPPKELTELDYIFFYPEKKVAGSGFGYGLSRLVTALNTDLVWVREHSRLGLLATSWQEAGKAPNRLLTGSDIEKSKAWLNARPKTAQEATELHRAFITASENAERARITRENAQEAAQRDGEIKRLKAEQEAQRLTLEAAKLKAEQQAAVAEARRRRSQMLLAVPVVLLLAGSSGAWVWVDRARNVADRARIAAENAVESSRLRAETAEKDQRIAERDTRLAERDKQAAQLQAQLEKLKRETAAAGPVARSTEITVAEAPAAGLKLLSADEVSRRISPDAIELIEAMEVGSRADYDRKYQHPSWPQGNTGITIGIGYDLGYVSAQSFRRDWEPHLDAATFERLSPAIGKRSAEAESSLHEFRDLVISWDQALSVFRERTLSEYGARVDKVFPNANEPPPDSFGALVSLVFNRGTSLEGERRAEMASIAALMEQRKFDAIPAEIRKMKRLWPSLGAMQKRRDAEAALFEKGLVTAKKI